MNGGSRYRSPDREGTMREGVEASAMNGEGCRLDGRNRRIPGHMRLPGGEGSLLLCGQCTPCRMQNGRPACVAGRP